MLNRRQFVRIVPALGTFAVASTRVQAQAPGGGEWPGPPPPAGAPRDESFPSQHPFLAREMVTVAHGNIARVKELLARSPALVNASWDWGFGDWETPLGAASHVGNRFIAELLIEHGAGPTIFSAAMLGQLDVVKAFAAGTPDINRFRGPHSIPLINHARAGGAGASEVLKYLESLGNVPKTGDLEPLTGAERTSLEGRYIFGDGPRDAFVVDTVQDRLGIARVGAGRRVINHLGKLEFHPVGAQAVRIRFSGTPAAMTLSVFDPDLLVEATRRS